MGNKKLNNIDVNKIDLDSFGEALLLCVANTKRNCKNINTQVAYMASIAFVPWVSTNEQYDAVVNKMLIKSELINLYKLFIDWSKGISDKQKRLYMAYFIKKDKNLCRKIANDNYHKRGILTMASSFMVYLKNMTDIDEKELINNPFIYKAYANIIENNESFQKRGFWKNKGGHVYDNSANERCYRCRI